MPARAARECSHPGCRTLTLDGRCAKHPRIAWARPKPTQRIRGRKLQTLRLALFARKPLCAECEKAGRVTLAVIRDHIVNLEEGGADDESNTQGLCIQCHDLKTQAEAERGIGRAAWGIGKTTIT